jgi:hypothetical protein
MPIGDDLIRLGFDANATYKKRMQALKIEKERKVEEENRGAGNKYFFIPLITLSYVIPLHFRFKPKWIRASDLSK